MVIHSARPQAARTTQNNPLKTNGPKNPDPSTADCRGGVQRAGRRGGRCRRGIVPGGVCCTVLDLLAWFPCVGVSLQLPGWWLHGLRESGAVR